MTPMTIAQVNLNEIWTGAAVLMGFQLAAFVWRLNRETEVQKMHADNWNWMPPADYLSLASMLVTVFGVFVLPISGVIDPSAAQVLFGLSAILFAGYQLALLGHYKLLFHGPVRLPGQYCTIDEALIIFLTLMVCGIYLARCFGLPPFA
jgi:hypothetical protein